MASSNAPLIVRPLREAVYIVALPANAAAHIANSSAAEILNAELPRLGKWVGK